MVEKLNVKELGPDQPDVKISQQEKEKGKLYTRRFSQNWYTRKQWLAGCNHANALFCFLCLLFKTAGIHRRWMWNLCLIGDSIHSLTEECSASVQQPTKKRRTFGQGEQQLGAEEAAVMGTPVCNTEVADDGASNQTKRKRGLSSFFKAPHRPAAPGAEHTLQLDQAIACELQGYLQAGTLDTEEDPLGWWKLSQNLFPRLCILAKKYLCIPATSASSERVFSTGGNVVNCLCASLRPDHVNRLVFLAKNL
nr:uncharacterized protein LOC129163319 [Nothobranchius furzeri]